MTKVMNVPAKDWVVLSATCSPYHAGLHLRGRNLNYDNEPESVFAWTVGRESLANPRYDWSQCAFGDGARERLDAALARAAEGGR